MPAFLRAAFVAALIASPFAATAGGHATEGGVVTIESAHDVSMTIDRLVDAVEGAGATIFARVDHAAGAAEADMELRPAELLIFGNPKLGTPVMQSAPTMGVDLPLRVLAWEDADGKVHVSYTDPAAMAARHGLEAEDETIVKIAGALGKLTAKATSE